MFFQYCLEHQRGCLKTKLLSLRVIEQSTTRVWTHTFDNWYLVELGCQAHDLYIDLPLSITISDTCKNQTKRFDFDDTINLSSLIQPIPINLTLDFYVN
jgi:hypothetical protein